MFRLFLLLSFLLLPACASVTVDEDLIFQPQLSYEQAQALPDRSLEWEEAFAGDKPVEIEIEAWSEQRATIMLNEDQLSPANVSHGFLGDGDDRTAYTLIARADENRPLIVHCGGSTASRRDSGTPYGLKVIEFGDVLLFDYPGYGDSPGMATGQSLAAMNDRIIEFAKKLTANNRQLILWGHSLGGFVCADMASSFEGLGAIVFETSARNAAEVADTIPAWYIKPFVRFNISDGIAGFDNVTAIENVAVPILVLGARLDRTLRVRLSRGLADDLQAAGHDVTYVEFPDANHISIATSKTFQAVTGAFFKRVANLSPDGLAL